MKIKIIRKEQKQTYEAFEDYVNKVVRKIETSNMTVVSLEGLMTEGVLTMVLTYE